MTRATRILSVLSALLLGAFAMNTAHAWAQAGPVGTSVQQYSGGVRWPDVAYDSYNRVFLVVWGPGTIRGIFVSEDGNPIGSSFRISDSTPWAQTPRAVFNPDTGVFLVAWQSSDGIEGNSSATIVRGRMVSYTSGVSAQPTKAYSANTYSTRWETGPALGYSTESGNFMVVWNRYSTSGAEVGARLVSAAGDPVGSEIVITSTTDEYEREPTVGYLPASNRFLVAWAASGSVDSVRGKLYDASTGGLVGAPLLFAQSTFTYVPEAALNRTTGQLLVTWMQSDPATALPGNGWRPFGRLVDGNGAFVSASPTRLSSIAGAYDANSVAFNALTQSFFLVTHGSTTLQDVGFEISGTGTPVSTASAVTSVTAANLTGTFNPRINASSQAARWLVATSASFGSLWTQVIAGDGVAPPPDGGGTVNPRLTITPTPAGGTVTGGGMTCGTGGTNCQLTFTQSTSVTLQATADAGFQFSGWGGACSGTSSSSTVQVGAILYCSATFVPSWGGADSQPPGCPAVPTPVFQAQPGPIGASVNQYTGGTQNQDVAYNQCQQVYLAVWGMGGTIRGRFINENGQGMGDAFAISSGQWAQTPKVIYNPNIGNFLVVWHSSASDTRTEVRAQLVTYPAGVPAAGAALSASTYSTRWVTKPAIGYSRNSGRYLVAWARYAADGGAEINARFINTQAVPVANEFAVSSSADEYDREPTIGHIPSTDRVLVAWAGSGPTADFVRGKLYDVATGAAFGTPLTFAQTRFTYVPEATLNTDTGNVFVAWMQDDAATALPGNGWRPFGNGVNGSGQLVFTSAKRLSSTVGAYDANSIAYNPISKTFFLVTHGANTLQDVGFEIGGDGTSLGTAAVVTSITWPNLSGSFNPRIAASTRQPQWLVSTAASFQSMWTQLIGGKDTGGVFGSFTLAISPKPTGGVVTGGGLTCGTGGTACSVTFASATSVTISATADTGYLFSGWGGACSGTSTTTTVAIDSAKTCTAAFTLSGSSPTTYALAVSPTPVNGTVSGGGLTCGAGGAVCQVDVASGTSVTLTATPMSGYSLTSWGGSCTGTGTTTTVLMSAARTCSATFGVGLPTGPPYTMTISPKPAGGTIAGAGLNCGTGGNLCAVTMPAPMGLGMSAAPAAGYNFGAWTGDCSGLTTGLTVQLSGPRTCSATFIPVGATFQLNVSPAPTGGTVTGGGITCGIGGSTCQVTYGSATSVLLNAAPASGYTFAGWGGSCTGTNTSTTIQVDGIRTCTAAFAATPTYQLNVSPVPTGGTVTGGGIACGTGGSTCQATYGSSTSVTLTAAPASGYTFSSWGGSCTGTSTSTTVQVNAVRTCSATFTAGAVNGPPYTMSISPRPTGGTVTGAGLNCGTGGSLCAVTMPAAMTLGIQATPSTGYTFGGWTGDCTGTNAGIYVWLGGARTCGATFTPVGTTFQLNVSPAPTGGTVTGGGITCGTGGSTCQASYGASTSVTLAAAPASGYTFTGWGGSCTGTNTSTTVLVDGIRTCTAAFAAAPTYQLNVSPVPTGGTVTGAGITCGTGGSTCQATYGSSTSVTLTAAPASGYTFTSWGGSCTGTSTSTTVQVNAVRTCSATFTAGAVNGPPYTMSISPRPTGGTVTGAGLNCGTTGSLCAVTMPAAMTLGIQATPSAGYTFGGWTGDCTGTNAGIYVWLGGARTCGATFTPVGGTTYQLSVSPVPAGGTVTGAGITCGTGGSTCQATYGSSTAVTLTAAPASGYTFTGWGGHCTGTSASTTIQVDGVKTCTATFTTGTVNGPPYTMTVSPRPTGGTVTGAGLNCGTGGSLCAVTMPAPMSLGIQATAAAGYTFTGWSGNCTGTSPGIFVWLGGARTCSATFTPVGGGGD